MSVNLWIQTVMLKTCITYAELFYFPSPPLVLDKLSLSQGPNEEERTLSWGPTELGSSPRAGCHTGCVVLGRLLNLYELQFVHLPKDDTIAPLERL